ncbi:YihY/virulence factor BrkB family protein [Nemorincola caseinilytica]|uniref:YihY/virulence factor BrkB family protein n=1 Tax=Nemorincola caseinilytica TaxID=2054315 RepID=A0ABP8NBB9_9BACT
MKAKLRTFWELIDETITEFGDDHATKLSASLAYFTLFSIAPLLLVIIHIITFFYKTKDAEGKVLEQVSTFAGKDTAMQLEAMLKGISSSNSNTLFGVIGVVVFVFSATSIFTEIKSSINYMWSVRARPKRGWLKMITDRLLALVFIAGMGVLMIATLILNVAVDAIIAQLHHFHYLQQYLGGVDLVLITGLNTALLFVIVTFLFAVVFKVLPDANIHWKDILVGASFTGVLFMVGKFLITWYLTSSRLITAYGAAASLIILLSWIYYSALIVYFGAEFTDVYARKCGRGVTVRKTAVFVFKREARELPKMKTHTDQDLGKGDAV